MKIICQLTDKEILGKDGLANVPPRLTARAILENKSGLFAVMHAKKFNLYSLPGGGIEKDEAPIEGLAREILEETGCFCEEISELGKIIENRAALNYTQENFYYIVKAFSDYGTPKMTEKEIANETVVEWHTFEEIYRLIASPKHDTIQRMYIQARDVAALNEYSKQRIQK